MAGTAALINQGAEFVAADGLDAAAAAAARSAGHNSAFGALQAGYNEYATGSEVDLTSVTGVAGFAKGFSFGNDMLTAAVFLDLGSGSSDLYAGGYDGDADHEYYGIGAAVRYAFESGFFLDGSLRGGRTETVPVPLRCGAGEISLLTGLLHTADGGGERARSRSES